MKHNTILMLLAFPGILAAQIPLPSSPSWTSQDNDYSTGGAFADMNGDDRIDLCTSNGNDMAQNYNGVYLNLGDSLERTASWRSSDRGYFGHCYAGDVDNDADMDLAVAFLGPTGDLRVRVYRNTGTGLETTPYWKAQDQHSSFDCCLGDVDLDGDLDLAISAGDAYTGEIDSARIYRNNGGAFEPLPFWTAREGSASDAIRFCDIDGDGDLDLFTGHRRKVLMYRNSSGVLDSVPSWVARQGVGWVLRLEPGDFDGDGRLDLAAACNDQLGDPNGIRVYANRDGRLDTLPAFTMWTSRNLTSCVGWADLDNDGDYDLAAGGWWQRVAVFANDSGVLSTDPAWSWRPTDSTSLVCEAVAFADVRNRRLTSHTDRFDGDGSRRLFSAHSRPLQFLDSITVNGTRVPAAGYCFDPPLGWVSFATPPPSGTDNVALHYRRAAHPDLAVTNWVAARGNHLFLNTTAVGIADVPRRPAARLVACPNPSADLMHIESQGAAGADIRVYARDGRLVRTWPAARVTWDGRDEAGRSVVPGVYFARCAGASAKLIRLSPR